MDSKRDQLPLRRTEEKGILENSGSKGAEAFYQLK
jgi:hypothetical protein